MCARTLTRKLLSLSWVTMTTESCSFSSKWTWLWEPSASWPAAKRILRTLGLLPRKRVREGSRGCWLSLPPGNNSPCHPMPPPHSLQLPLISLNTHWLGSFQG